MKEGPSDQSKRIIFLVVLLIVTIVGFVYYQSTRYKFKLENIVTNEYNNWYYVYDFVFPTLLGLKIINQDASVSDKIDTAVSYVNFYSTPGLYQDYDGLGTKTHWSMNATLMLMSGNLECSEQSSLAALLLDLYCTNLAIRDVSHHTFHEIFVDGKWLIVDPMFDMRIKNNVGEAATFKDIQKYLAGDKKALALPDNILPRTAGYLSLFEKKKYKKIRHEFGENYELVKYNYLDGTSMSPTDFIKDMNDALVCSFDKAYCYNYMIYIRNSILYNLEIKRDYENEVPKIQDFFLEKIKQDSARGIGVCEKDINLYIARNYQFFERYDEALKIFDTLEQSDQIKFYKSQIYFVLKDKEKFNAYKTDLKDNIYYKYMFWELNGEFLDPGDDDLFSNFRYRMYKDGPKKSAMQ